MQVMRLLVRCISPFFGGSADAAVMNAGNFHYFTLGNHEFDAGNEGLLKLLEPLKIPVLSANVIPDKNSILYNKWKPYDIFYCGWRKNCHYWFRYRE